MPFAYLSALHPCPLRGKGWGKGSQVGEASLEPIQLIVLILKKL